jgi:PKHD-type hydroxylase
MNLFNYYYYFKSALTPRFCDELVRYGLDQKESIALTGGFENKDNKPLTSEEEKDLKKKRDSNIVWLNDNWIYNETMPYVHEANKKAGWNFEWSRAENCQFTKYKLNQYYDWHCDSWDKPYDKPNTEDHGKIRKLSMTCQLVDGSEYEGGELEFQARNLDDPNSTQLCTEIMPKGSIVVFPSFVWHRVKPVTSGTRYSLVVWHLGEPFK